MIIRKIAILLSMICLNACSLSSGTVPTDHFYRLPSIETEAVTNQSQSVIIKSVRVDGLYHERAMLYVNQSEPLEIKRYNYHYWVEPPASLIQKYLNSYFLKSGLTDEQSKLKTAHLILQPTLLNFERIVAEGKADAFVKLHIELQSNSNKDQSVTRNYEAKVTASSMDMHDTVSAFGKALDDIGRALVNDLTTR